MEITYAVIESGKVSNIVVGVEPEVIAENPDRYVEYTDANPAYIGLGFDKTTGVFEQPTQIPTE